MHFNLSHERLINKPECQCLIFPERDHRQTDYNTHVGCPVFCFQSMKVYLGKQIRE